jgi:hypothetical protein
MHAELALFSDLECLTTLGNTKQFNNTRTTTTTTTTTTCALQGWCKPKVDLEISASW